MIYSSTAIFKKYWFNIDKKEVEILENIKKLPFFNHFERDYSQSKDMLNQFKDKKDLIQLNQLLSNLFKKLNKKPKALIPFHLLDEYEVSPIEEIILYNEKISKKRNIYFKTRVS